MRYQICAIGDDRSRGSHLCLALPTYQVRENRSLRSPYRFEGLGFCGQETHIHTSLQTAWQWKSKWSFQHSWRPTKKKKKKITLWLLVEEPYTTFYYHTYSSVNSLVQILTPWVRHVICGITAIWRGIFSCVHRTWIDAEKVARMGTIRWLHTLINSLSSVIR